MRTPLPIIESCAGCGLCCATQADLPVVYFTVFGFPDDFPDDLRREIEDRVRGWNNRWPKADGKACVWYDAQAKRCRNYEHRPAICREFEMGGLDCRRYRERGGIDPH